MRRFARRSVLQPLGARDQADVSLSLDRRGRASARLCVTRSLAAALRAKCTIIVDDERGSRRVLRLQHADDG